MEVRLAFILVGLTVLSAACGSEEIFPPSPTAAATPTGAIVTSAEPSASPSGGAAASEGPETVTLAERPDSLSLAPLYIARDNHYFEKQGVRVEFAPLQTGTSAIGSLLDGSVDLTMSTSTAAAAAAAQGQPVLAIQGTANMTEQVCIRRKFMESRSVTPVAPLSQRMAAFRGAAIGALRRDNPSYRRMRWLVGKYGKINPDAAMTVVNVDDAGAMVEDIEANKIQGFLLPPPACQQAGKTRSSAEVLIKPSEIPEFKNYIHEVLVTTRDWAAGHEELATRIATSVSMGNNYLLQHPRESITLLEKDFDKLDPSVVQAAVNSVMLPQVPKDGKMTQDVWNMTDTVLVEAGILKQRVDVSEGALWTNAYLTDASVP